MSSLALDDLQSRTDRELMGARDTLRYLMADGVVDPVDALPVAVDAELALALYRDIVLTRALDQEAWNLQRQGELGLWLSCRGQEAAQVGSARALSDADWIFPAYREHGVGVVRGLTPGELLAQWRGCVHGGWDPARYRMHIYSLVLGTQTLHATGYAMGVRAEGATEIVCAYVGDGATSQGDVSEALNWAAVSMAPMVFICQNNQWAISTPVNTQLVAPLYERARGFGLEAVRVDGNDAIAVHAVTRWAADRVRAGGRPVFVEAMTYRMSGHSTSDDPTRYRDANEVALWEARDPLIRLRAYLDANSWASPTWLTNLQEESEQLARATRTACLSMPEPRLDDTFLNTYVEQTVALRAEHDTFTRYEESFL